MTIERSSLPLPGVSRTGVTISVTKVATVYHPGLAHNHSPCGLWSTIRWAPNSSVEVEAAAAISPTPMDLIRWAIYEKFGDKPIAKKHIYWYLSEGKGVEYNEDENLDLALRQEVGVRRNLKAAIESRGRKGLVKGHVMIDQGIYGPGIGQDFRFAWGALDRLDYVANFDTGTLHAWFLDRYEWHPVYPNLYTRFNDDDVRPTNAVHAAAVEMKSEGLAADYWMRGEATVPLSVVLSVPPPSDSATHPGLGLEGDD
jgi:hypothetical protein